MDWKSVFQEDLQSGEHGGRKKEAPSQTTDTTRARAGGVCFRLTQELEFCERSGDGGGDGNAERAPVAQLASARAPTRRQTGVGSDDAKERRELALSHESRTF